MAIKLFTHNGRQNQQDISKTLLKLKDKLNYVIKVEFMPIIIHKKELFLFNSKNLVHWLTEEISYTKD